MIGDLSFQRLSLPFSSVLLQALDRDKQPISKAFASGFIRRESGRLFLYTCWHVATTYDPHSIRIGRDLPDRRYLRIAIQNARKEQDGIEVIGGLTSFDIQLYEEESNPLKPRWHQDAQHIPHIDLNNIGLYVPAWHDVIKIELPESLHISDIQAVDETRLFQGDMSLLASGDKCVVVGYPYGFSALGSSQPTPVALTRFIACDRVFGRHQQLLLESIGAPGMSGGPVFVERDNSLLLFGIYTGAYFPDGPRGDNSTDRMKPTDLGTVANLSLLFWGARKLAQSPTALIR